MPTALKASPRKIIRDRKTGKLYDFGTSNRSFVQVASTLKSLGIKNWYFMLEICDPELVNIDPYLQDDNGHTKLTKDQIMRIMTELYRNPWYYLREISRIPDQGGTSVPYKLNRGNLAQAWCMIKGIDSWLCLPRRNKLSQNWVTNWKNFSNCWDLLKRTISSEVLNEDVFNDYRKQKCK